MHSDGDLHPRTRAMPPLRPPTRVSSPGSTALDAAPRGGASRVGVSGARRFSAAAAVAIMLCAGSLQAQDAAPAFRYDLGLRPGYHGSWGTTRDGSEREQQDLRMRLQLGGLWAPSPTWAVRARLAGRLSTEQETLRFFLRDHVPATDGLRLGEFTLDEAYLRWTPGEHLQVRVGRMQTSFELAGVARKSLDRNDSPNTDVTWTDGAHLSVRVRDGWRQHLVVQRHGSRGPTNVVRRPLDVTGSGTPVTVHTVAQFAAAGPLIQREVGVTYIPRSAPREGAERSDYVALVARGAVRPETRVMGGRLVLAAEVGAAAGAPSRVALGTGTPEDGRGSARAFQLTANLMEFRTRHSLGLVHARTGDGWLISPDIRENNRETELRYYFQLSRSARLDARIRDRRDRRIPTGALRGRHDRDVYLRATLRF
jgi:hypothetical protein